jgi:hypothetical protein
LLLSFIFVIFFLGRSALNPFNGQMFNFHDDTQAARIQQFVLNLKNLKVPPRIAPSFSNGLGFPVFNYYAPAPYWITSAFHLVGFDVITALKVSFLLALVLAFFFMYRFLRLYFDFYPSLFGGLLYASSPWMAIEIFIRGNLAEIWFLALLPLVFLMIATNSRSKSPWTFVMTVIALSLGLTSHNVLSIVLLLLLLVFIFLNKNRLRNYFALILAFSLSAYFFIPAVLEVGMTHAAAIAKNRHYVEHLLCPWQLWTTPFWGYGGSGPDCNNDGMSFMLGKPQIVLGLIGLVFMIKGFFTLKKNENRKIFLFMVILTSGSLFLSTTLSTPVSKILEPALSFFQFPWRFSSFSVFGIAFIAAAIKMPKSVKGSAVLLGIVALFVVFYNGKFFTKHLMTNERFNKDYLSQVFISKMVVYKVAEYLPKTVDYKNWLTYEPVKGKPWKKDPTLEDGKFIHLLENGRVQILKNGLFEKQAETAPGTALINVHYMPYWKITINKMDYIPKTFDSLGRPLINLSSPSLISVKYEQTLAQKFGNLVTILTIFLLVAIVKSKNLWKKIEKI